MALNSCWNNIVLLTKRHAWTMCNRRGGLQEFQLERYTQRLLQPSARQRTTSKLCCSAQLPTQLIHAAICCWRISDPAILAGHGTYHVKQVQGMDSMTGRTTPILILCILRVLLSPCPWCMNGSSLFTRWCKPVTKVPASETMLCGKCGKWRCGPCKTANRARRSLFYIS